MTVIGLFYVLFKEKTMFYDDIFSEDYTVYFDFADFDFDYSLNSDFVSAFVYVSLYGYEPEFRLVYEPGEYPQMVWVSLGRFARVHGRMVNIDHIVDFDVEDLKSIPGEGC